MLLSHRPTLQLGDTTLRFPWDSESGRIGLEIFPTALTDQLVLRRKTLRGLPYIDAIPDAGEAPAYVIDSLAQVKIVGDPYPGAFSQGHTMRNSPSVEAFSYDSQRTEHGGSEVVTVLKSKSRGRIEHRISWKAGEAAAEVST